MTELDCNAWDYSHALLTVVIAWLASWALGHFFNWLIRALRLDPMADSSATVDFKKQLILAAVGLNLLGLCAASLNLLSLGAPVYRSALVLALASSGSVLFACRVRGYLQRTHTAHGTPSLISTFQWRDWLVVVTLGIITLGQAFALPSGWDELVYHRTLPERWHTLGRMAVFPDIPYSGFPSLLESIFWVLAPMSSSLSASLLTWSVWIAGLVILQLLLQVSVGNRFAQLFVLGLGTTDTMLMISGNCYVEPVALMNIAGLLYVLRFQFDGACQGAITLANFLRASVFASGSLALKLTGLPVLVVPILYVTVHGFRRVGWLKSSLQASIVVGCVCAFFLLPFFIRPWLATSNPFYPYFDQWFTDDTGRLETSIHHHALGAAFGVRGMAGDLMAPLLLSCSRDVFDGSFGLQSLLWFGIPLGVLALKRSFTSTHIASLASVALLLFAFWSATAQQARFAIPAMVSMLVLCAESWRDLSTKVQRWLAASMLVLILLSVPWPLVGYYYGGWQILAGRLTQLAFLREGVGDDYLALVNALREQTDKEDKVLLLFEHRSFYLMGDATCEIATPMFQSEYFTPIAEYDTVEKILHHLRSRKVTHVVLSVVQSGPDFSPETGERLIPFLDAFASAVAQKQLVPIWEEGRFKILQVVPSVAP